MQSILPCSSILPCPPCLPPVILSTGGPTSCWGSCLQQGEGDLAWGGGGGSGRGEGAGDISVQLPLLHYHMVLRPEGTSHNNGLPEGTQEPDPRHPRPRHLCGSWDRPPTRSVSLTRSWIRLHTLPCVLCPPNFECTSETEPGLIKTKV